MENEEKKNEEVSIVNNVANDSILKSEAADAATRDLSGNIIENQTDSSQSVPDTSLNHSERETPDTLTQSIETSQEQPHMYSGQPNQERSSQTPPPIQPAAPTQAPPRTPYNPSENKWKTAWIIVLFVALAMASGAVGGYLSARHEANRLADEIEEIEEKTEKSSGNSEDIYRYFFNNPYNGFNSNGSDSSSGSGSAEAEESPNKAALGIMVYDTNDGVEIVGFSSGSNASDAGLKKGDIIVKADGKDISSVSELRQILSKKSAGDTISIVVKRDGKEQGAVKVKLIENSHSSHPDFPDGGNIQG